GYTIPSRTIGAMTAAMKIVRSARVGPTAAPTTAIRVTSPKPIAGRFNQTSPSQPTIEIAPAPTHMPRIASHGRTNGSDSPRYSATIDVTSTKNKPKTVKPSGIRKYLASVIEIPSSTVANTATRKAVNVMPSSRNAASHNRPTNSSTTGY